jgi:hypothetical protein
VAPPRRHRTVQEREARWVVTVWLPVTPQFRVLVLSCSRALAPTGTWHALYCHLAFT